MSTRLNKKFIDKKSKKQLFNFINRQNLYFKIKLRIFITGNIKNLELTDRLLYWPFD